jgi:hypothetical protein
MALILLVVVINVAIGLFQEGKAEKVGAAGLGYRISRVLRSVGVLALGFCALCSLGYGCIIDSKA